MATGTMAFDDVMRIERTLFFEPPELRARLVRFVMLILFASVISSGGLMSDSTATVIGAMIVAPLMTPIMGMVVAVVIGSRDRVWRSALVVLIGIALSVGVGWLMATVMPFGWEPTSSGQIVSRTSPRMLDLVIALASGGAGAYALSRVDIADALPGVAISISLVPPLNAAGILLAGAEGDLATGAMVLFLTNFGAILLAGTITFVVTGLARAVGRKPAQIRSALLAIIVFVALIAVPLRANSNLLWQDASREEQSLTIVRNWLNATAPDWEIYQVKVDGNEVTIMVGGEGELPPAQQAVQQFRDLFDADVAINLRIVDVRQRTLASTPPPGE